MRSAVVAYLLALFTAGGAKGGTDLYPDVRVLLGEIETTTAHIPSASDRSYPAAWTARLYARAGYLNDADRVSGKASRQYQVLLAHVVYGDLEGVEASLRAIADPKDKADSLTSLGDVLWRMGQPELARSRFEEARRIAPKIANLKDRTRVMTSIASGLSYLSQDPPHLVSAKPEPRRRFEVQDFPIPLFPVTTDGFRDLDLNEVTKRASVNAVFMQKIYDLMKAGDSEGPLRVAEGAATPFQTILGIASIEHILIQANQPEAAEQYAKRMPQTDSDCLLAKAEALSAAAAAWLRAGDSNRAHLDFATATGLVRSVRDLPMGKVLVIVAIADAQAKGGMVASAGTNFSLAKELALALPLRPPPVKGAVRNAGPVKHYRDEAYKKILPAAIRAHDLGTAREVAALWRKADVNSDASIVRAWLGAERTDEALAFARGITEPVAKAEALLVLADQLLDTAGAPYF